MDKKQLTELIIIPTLKEIPKGYSEEAVMAIQMIIAHESCGGKYIAQTKGPALGVIQMEPFTHDQVWKFNTKQCGVIKNSNSRHWRKERAES